MWNFQINWNFLLLLRALQLSFPFVLSEENSQVDADVDESMYTKLDCRTTVVLDETGDAWQLFRLPPLKPPFFCFWNFVTKDKLPFQMEIHQLENIGRWDHVNKICNGGFVLFSEKEWINEANGNSKTSTKLCDDPDENRTMSYSRISTPFYAARGVLWVSILVRKPEEAANLVPKLNIVTTVTPLMMDFPQFHFPQVPVGGTFLAKSGCDILFTNCAEEECLISSENYPGVQMNSGACNYIFRTRVKTDRIRMKFQMSIEKPIDCNLNFISISSSLNSTSLSKDEKVLTRICEESATVEIEAISDIIVQYHTAIEKPFSRGLNSGSFSGRIRFIHTETGNFKVPRGKAWRAFYRERTFDREGNLTGRQFEFTHENLVQFSGSGSGSGTNTDLAPISNRLIPLKAELISTVFCGDKIDGTIKRAGRFQLLLQPPQKLESNLSSGSESESELEKDGFNCSLSFSGDKFDIIAIRICTDRFYKVLKTETERKLFYVNDKDGSTSKNQEPQEICQDINTLQNFNSSRDFIFQMKLKKPPKDQRRTELKYIKGTFVFHDQKTEGYFTNPSTKDKIIFKDGKVSSRGQLLGPPPLHFLNSSFRKKSSSPPSSSAVLIPGKNHLLRLELKRADSYAEYIDLRPGKNYCQSVCSSSCGCKIYGPQEIGTTLDSFDRISVQVGLGLGFGFGGREKEISCFCGLSPETPFKIYSNIPLRVNFHMANENSIGKSEMESEMTYSAQYEFLDGDICPELTLNFDPEERMGISSVVILKPKLGKDGNLWSFQCTWDFSIYPRTTTQLFLTSVGNEDEIDHVSSWNISVNFYISKQKGKGWTTHEWFCSEDKSKEIKFPGLARKGRLMMAGVVTHAPEIWLNWTAVEIETEEEKLSEGGGGGENKSVIEIKMSMINYPDFDWRADALWSSSVALGIFLSWTCLVCLICRVTQRNRKKSQRETLVQRDESREKIRGFGRPENTVVYPDDRY